MDESQGLVNGYLTEVGHLAAKRQMGTSIDDLMPKIKDTVTRAKDHMSIWVTGTPENNWAHFIGQLKFRGTLAQDERYTEVMHLAASLAEKETPPERPKK